jgi:hypothetical protein
MDNTHLQTPKYHLSDNDNVMKVMNDNVMITGSTTSQFISMWQPQKIHETNFFLKFSLPQIYFLSDEDCFP